MIRFHWNFNSEFTIPASDRPAHSTDLSLDEGLTSEAVIKERIATTEGDRCLAQYIVINSMERVKR